MYNLMNRGERREPIFKDDPDRHRFLEIFGEACAKTRWQVHADCHPQSAVVETPQANLVAGMKRPRAGLVSSLAPPKCTTTRFAWLDIELVHLHFRELPWDTIDDT